MPKRTTRRATRPRKTVRKAVKPVALTPKTRCIQKRISVTTDLIRAAVPKDSGHCMIADAIKVAVPRASKVSVDLQQIRFSDPKKGLRYSYLTPLRVVAALIKFDEGHEPKPFEFRLPTGQVVQMHTRTGPRKHTKKMLGSDGLSHKRPTVIGGKLPPQVGRSRKVPATLEQQISIGRIRKFGVKGLAHHLESA